jgi:hypothetical protein
LLGYFLVDFNFRFERPDALIYTPKGAPREWTSFFSLSASAVARLFRGGGLVANGEENPASEEAGYSSRGRG